VVVIVVRCDACGGSVAYDAAKEHARCLFCAAVALQPELLDAPPEPPRAMLPFRVDESAAQASFRAWTRASWWRPKELRDAIATMRPLWLPAWRVRADVELHWAALERAPTKSGKRPRAGVDQREAEVLVPASLGISQAELVALRPFEGALRDAQDDDAAIARELPSLSAKGARARAIELFTHDRLAHVGARERVTDAGGTVRLHDVQIELQALPIWVGSVRHRDRPWRFVVNGASGKVVGRAPLDRIKVALAVALGVLVLLGVIWLLDRDPEPVLDSPCVRAPDDPAAVRHQRVRLELDPDEARSRGALVRGDAYARQAR
jgi:hypothetical protein